MSNPGFSAQFDDALEEQSNAAAAPLTRELQATLPVITISTELPVFICPDAGEGMLVLPDSVSDEQFGEVATLLEAIDWVITDEVLGENSDGAQVVRLSSEPQAMLTVELMADAKDQLARQTKLVETPLAEQNVAIRDTI
jgi:hypothetical protein